MEFFAEARSGMRDADLQRYLRIDNLPQWCASIDNVLSSDGDRGEIYCLWGQFRIRREILRDGVRYTLPTCPNALQWSVTAGDRPGVLLIHCTINRRRHDAEFVESIEQFIAHWKAGLEAGGGLPAKRVVGECPPWFG